MPADKVQKKSKKVNKRRRRNTGSSSSEHSDMAIPKTSETNLPTSVAVAPVFSVSNTSTLVQGLFQ